MVDMGERYYMSVTSIVAGASIPPSEEVVMTAGDFDPGLSGYDNASISASAYGSLSPSLPTFKGASIEALRDGASSFIVRLQGASLGAGFWTSVVLHSLEGDADWQRQQFNSADATYNPSVNSGTESQWEFSAAFSTQPSFNLNETYRVTFRG